MRGGGGVRGGGVQKVGRGVGRVWPAGRRPGFVGASLGRGRPVAERLGVAVVAPKMTGADLRDILTSKQKQQVVDLRAKIKQKPKSPVTVGRSGGRGRSQRGGGGGRTTSDDRVGGPTRRARSRSPVRKQYAPQFSSPPLPRRQRANQPTRLPSAAETKKITVTVPGLNRPVSEVSGSTSCEQATSSTSL